MASASNMARNLNNAQNNTIAGLAGRLKTELALKLGLVVILYPLVFVPYFFLQRHHFFPATTMSFGLFDRLIPFSDQAVWPYFSIYLLLPIGPFFMGRRNQLLRYAAGIVLMSLIADLIFLCWPTFCPRPAMYRRQCCLSTTDSRGQFFQCLSVVARGFCGLFGVVRRTGFARTRESSRLAIGDLVWALLILYATLATRQHVLVDVIAGSVLGAAAYAAVFTPGISIFKSKTSLQAVALDLNQTPSNIK
jgi:hypothetical protein